MQFWPKVPENLQGDSGNMKRVKANCMHTTTLNFPYFFEFYFVAMKTEFP